MTPFADQPPPVVLAPELHRVTGGVQVFSRRMIEALDALYDQPVPVISRNDRQSDCPVAFLRDRKFTGCGALPNGLRRFGIMAASAFNRAPFIVSTHPHFSPWLKVLKRPFLSVAHGIDVWNIKGSKVASGLQAAKCILPVSQYTSGRMAPQIPPPAPPLEIFPNTFDAGRFFPSGSATPWRKNLNLPEEAILMLSICRVSKGEEGKGYHRLLELMPRLLAQHPNLHWVLGGKGNDLDHVKQKAEQLGVSANCRFPGFISDDSLPDLYRSSDLFVLPSKKEGFGIVFLEAAATGLPVIAGNRDGSVDALADGALGCLIDPEDDDQIVNAIDQTLSKPPRDRQDLHNDCESRFGKNAFRERLSEIITRHFY